MATSMGWLTGLRSHGWQGKRAWRPLAGVLLPGLLLAGCASWRAEHTRNDDTVAATGAGAAGSRWDLDGPEANTGDNFQGADTEDNLGGAAKPEPRYDRRQLAAEMAAAARADNQGHDQTATAALAPGSEDQGGDASLRGAETSSPDLAVVPPPMEGSTNSGSTTGVVGAAPATVGPLASSAQGRGAAVGATGERQGQCGFVVYAKSSGAVGNPCMSTREFARQLGLSQSQIRHVLRAH